MRLGCESLTGYPKRHLSLAQPPVPAPLLSQYTDPAQFLRTSWQLQSSPPSKLKLLSLSTSSQILSTNKSSQAWNITHLSTDTFSQSLLYSLFFLYVFVLGFNEHISIMLHLRWKFRVIEKRQNQLPIGLHFWCHQALSERNLEIKKGPYTLCSSCLSCQPPNNTTCCSQHTFSKKLLCDLHFYSYWYPSWCTTYNIWCPWLLEEVWQQPFPSHLIIAIKSWKQSEIMH